MTGHHHTTHDPDADAVNVRDVDDEGATYELQDVPISSDATARDGVAFDRERLESFRDQINAGDQPVPLMVDHGKSEFGGDARYSVLGRVGTVESADLERDGDSTLLRATMRVADADALADEGDAGEIEAALRYLRFQAENMGLSFSVGWQENSDRDTPGEGSEILEVSAVAIPSDVTSSTASAEPSEAAARGFQSLPNQQRQYGNVTVPENWGFRGHDPEPPTDAERATEALDELAHVRDHHTQDDDVSPHKRSDETPPTLATIDELRRSFGHDRDTVDVETRLATLADPDTRNDERERDGVLARLESVEDAAPKLAQPDVTHRATASPVKVYPFGRSAAESRERIADAAEALRDVLTEDETVDGWGMAPRAEEGR